MTPSDESILCGKCGKKRAANHICYGGAGTSINLCDECLRADDSIAAQFVDEAKRATCSYCGGYPCVTGGTNSFAQITGGSTQNRWMCISCSTEYYSHMQNAFPTISGDLAHDEQIELIKKVSAAADEHMAAFVRRRSN